MICGKKIDLWFYDSLLTQGVEIYMTLKYRTYWPYVYIYIMLKLSIYVTSTYNKSEYKGD